MPSTLFLSLIPFVMISSDRTNKSCIWWLATRPPITFAVPLRSLNHKYLRVTALVTKAHKYHVPVVSGTQCTKVHISNISITAVLSRLLLFLLTHFPFTIYSLRSSQCGSLEQFQKNLRLKLFLSNLGLELKTR